MIFLRSELESNNFLPNPQSSKLAEVIYNLSWHDDQCRIRMKKNLLFMMMRFQKPVTVRTRYFKLNKENFANVQLLLL
jgi:hypothetical protein